MGRSGTPEQRLTTLEDHPLAAARLIGPVVLATGVNRIRHGLRRARGRWTVKISAAVDLYDTDDADPAYWVVTSSGAATATFLFF